MWFHALLGYVNAISSDATEHSLENSINGGWSADVHLIGKDILRFHVVYWPSMLLSAKMKVPKKVFIRSDLPKTGSGKVLKRELKQWVQENS